MSEPTMLARMSRAHAGYGLTRDGPRPDARVVTLNAANYDSLREGLRELGYIEGRNLVIEYRSADGRTGRFPDLATELVRRDVDLIITRGTPAALAAKNVTATIPVVMAASGDPVG